MKSESESKSLFQLIGEFLFTVTLGVATMLCYAWVASLMWAWFLVPSGLMILPYAAFVGIFLLIGLANMYLASITPKKLEESKEASWAFSTGVAVLKILLAFVVLGAASLYHVFLF